ncbi:hypothetical protein [Halobacillus litoralis]|uniref:Uncharacterized protein n=1 Tax=Halobacillus litoralis TaxID=45668 RepID=A0A410MI40_9BACI|nr:hypothetical protein [Halobacillus litoralis]QAS54350.1 hypothetical protein HLI_20065 [Halobacillus litoralis]
MNPLIILIIILISVTLDYLWFDVDRKRWGWMKKWPRFQKGLFLASFVIAAVVIYIGLAL